MEGGAGGVSSSNSSAAGHDFGGAGHDNGGAGGEPSGTGGDSGGATGDSSGAGGEPSGTGGDSGGAGGSHEPSDIDECLDGTDNCDANAMCANVPGSFTCACRPGYTGSGLSCTDVDECLEGTDNCDANATCANTTGSFTCKCKGNFVGNGLACFPQPSCVGLTPNCGESSSDDCCASLMVPGGDFILGPETVFGQTSAATIATFALDKYEVTVGRFRKFVDVYAGHPPSGAGAHPLIAGSGWQSVWDDSIASNVSLFASFRDCNPGMQTWSTSGATDRLPMSCVDWFEAFAFCAWDGGRLPTEAEWEYAAAGGAEERTYPWGAAAPDSSYAVYECTGDGSAAGSCAVADMLPVGSRPSGAGKYGHMDLAGSMWEWVLDGYSAYPASCDNCATIGSIPYRMVRGGAWSYAASDLAAAGRWGAAWNNTARVNSLGFRCARTP